MVVTLEVSKLSGWLNADAPWNIKPMLVTLEVSKPSGWLNADAPWPESKRGRKMRGELPCGLGGGRRQATAAHAACPGEGSTADWGQGTGSEAHVEHLLHVCDVGGVEAQRLVERRRALPRGRTEGIIRCAWRGAGREEEMADDVPKVSVQGEGLTADSAQGTGRSARGTCRPAIGRWRCRSSAAG